MTLPTPQLPRDLFIRRCGQRLYSFDTPQPHPYIPRFPTMAKSARFGGLEVNIGRLTEDSAPGRVRYP